MLEKSVEDMNLLHILILFHFKKGFSIFHSKAVFKISTSVILILGKILKLLKSNNFCSYGFYVFNIPSYHGYFKIVWYCFNNNNKLNTLAVFLFFTFNLIFILIFISKCCNTCSLQYFGEWVHAQNTAWFFFLNYALLLCLPPSFSSKSALLIFLLVNVSNLIPCWKHNIKEACLSINWIKKVLYLYMMVYYSAVKKNKSETFTGNRWTWKV